MKLQTGKGAGGYQSGKKSQNHMSRIILLTCEKFETSAENCTINRTQGCNFFRKIPRLRRGTSDVYRRDIRLWNLMKNCKN